MTVSIYKALLFKDWKLLKAQGKSLAVIMALIIGMNILSKNYFVLPSFINIIATTVVLTSIGGDDLAKFYSYAFSTPITRKNLVASKYLLMGTLSIITMIVNLLLFSILGDYNIEMIFISFFPSWMFSIFVVIIMIPATYKLGINQAKLILMLMFFLAFSAGTEILKEISLGGVLSKTSIGGIVGVSLVVGLILAVISYKISLKIIENKEY